MTDSLESEFVATSGPLCSLRSFAANIHSFIFSC
jgi:hypothetical protein